MDDNQNLIHSLDVDKDRNQLNLKLGGGIILAAILLGVLSGYIVTKITIKRSSPTSIVKTTKGTVIKQTAGKKDKSTFKDHAQGLLKEGGIDGEGSFHLERPGGESQNVYLTSSTIDLSKYIGEKVIVWGQTFQAKKAGWLMDVGYIEIVK